MESPRTTTITHTAIPARQQCRWCGGTGVIAELVPALVGGKYRIGKLVTLNSFCDICAGTGQIKEAAWTPKR